jgi:hypothetical protein
MTDPTPSARLIATAKGYPFARPGHSYLFVDGAALPLLALGGGALEEAVLRVDGKPRRAGAYFRELGIRVSAPLSERTAVLAYGANGAPRRLARKFAAMGPGVVIPVLSARLYDFDVVYAGHFSSYGAIPATLEASPGARAQLEVTYLDAPQLARMHETELSPGNYAYGLLSEVRLAPEGESGLSAVHSYLTHYGCLAARGAPVALAQVAVAGRRFGAMSKLEVLRHARDLLAADQELDAFILEIVRDDAVRAGRNRARNPFRDIEGLRPGPRCGPVSRAPSRQQCRRRPKGRPSHWP